MKILWFTWKDRKNPAAGGAELMGHELAKRLVRDGYEVIFLVPGFEGAQEEEWVDGFKIIRLGNKWTVYWKAFRYYKKNLRDWPDLIIDEYQAVPFFTKFYAKQKKVILFYQLIRNIWFYQMFFPLSLVGYIFEPIYLRLINNMKAITISKSTKDDLISYGFKDEKIDNIGVGIENDFIKDLNLIKKFDKPTLLSVGCIRPMKQTHHIVKAFEIAKKEIPELQLIIAGDASGKYGRKALKLMQKSRYSDSIQYLGKISKEKKIELMGKSHVIAVTSVREGWGLVVTEANSQGTPAVVYNIRGLKDSVRDGETGLIAVKNTPPGLAQKIVEILSDKNKYDELRKNGWEWSKKINFENCYKEFISKISK